MIEMTFCLAKTEEGKREPGRYMGIIDGRVCTMVVYNFICGEED